MDNHLESSKEANVFSVEELLLNRGVVVEDVAVSELDLNDQMFATHDESDDVSALEESLHADGQLDPIIVRRHDGRWQVVDGFRRVRAATHLGWHKLKARRFDALPAATAALWAVKNITMTLPYPEALAALAARLDEGGELEAGMLVRRYAESLEVVGEPTEDAVADTREIEAPGASEEEVTLDVLAEQTLDAFSAQSENVALLQENWADVPEESREALRAHLRYYAELLQFLDAPAEAEEAGADAPPSDDAPTE